MLNIMELGPMMNRTVLLLALAAMMLTSLFAFAPVEGVEPRMVEVNAPPPEGYIHRPLVEFFTGLSCPACMGKTPDDDSPEKAVHDTWLEGQDDPSAPFSAIVFHELNGGGVDDLNNAKATERMKFYQPGLSGTPDVQFDGGYIEIGGFSASNKPIDQPTIDWALIESGSRDENAPLRPLERLSWNFPYVMAEVDQIFDGTSFYVEVKVTYSSNAKMIGGNLLPLQGSLSVFMVEDNVTAYSLVYDLNVSNDAVFRGYAAEDERFQMTVGQEEIFSFTYDIPTTEDIQVKPQDMYAVAAIFDTQDTDSSPGGTDGNQRANSPRTVQSATSRSTAYDRENEPAKVEGIDLVDSTITVSMDDEGGIARAFVFINTEGTDVPVWTPYELTLTGGELCDEDTGVCFAYSDATGTATIDYSGGPLFAQVLLYDDQFAQSSSEVYSLVKEDPESKEKSSFVIGVSMGSIGLTIGILLVLIGPILYFVTRKMDGKITKRLSSKATLAVIVALGIIITAVSASSVLTTSTSSVPDFTVTDTRGSVLTPEYYEGKTLVIDIMFTTCASCNEEMPQLVEVYNEAISRHGDDVEFLSVSVDNEDTDKMLNDFQSKYGAKWPIALNRDFIELFDALSVPKLVIISPNGDIVYQHTGIINKEKVLEKIDDSESGDFSTVSLTQSGGSLIAFGSLAALFGIATFFSPCSLPMLPGYISYYINQESSTGKKHNPLLGGILAALGIISFFVIIGILVAMIGSAIQQYLRFFIIPIGGLLVVLGFLTLIGKDAFMERGIDYLKKPFEYIFSKIRGTRYEDDSGTSGLFAYGFGYGAASSSCMAAPFIGMILISFGAGGLVGGMLIFGLYTLSLGAMMVIFTYMASSGSELLQKLVSKTDTIKKVSAVLLMMAGSFVVLYALVLEQYLGSLFSFGF